VFGYIQLGGFKRLFEYRDSLLGLRVTAHKHIKRGITSLWPGMHTDVRFREDGDTGNTAVGGEMMQMDMQQGCAGDLNGFPELSFHQFQVIKMTGAPEVEYQMGSSEF